MVRASRARSVVFGVLAVCLAGRDASAQIVISRPALEVGIRSAALEGATASGAGVSPHVTWNPGPRTAVELSTDFRPASTSTFSNARRNVGFIELKRALYAGEAGR